MSILGTFHSHTFFSDGHNSPQEMVLAAINKKFKFLGIADHAPLLFPNLWGMKQSKLTAYFKEIAALKQVYNDEIELYSALEVDFIPRFYERFNYFRSYPALDYIIGSVHFLDCLPNGEDWDIASNYQSFAQGLKLVFNNNSKHFVKYYFNVYNQMLNSVQPDIAAHLDLIQKHNKDGSLIDNKSVNYKKMMTQTLENIAQKGIILEINTRGFYKASVKDFYPSQSFFPLISELEMKVTASSDAHDIDEINKGFVQLEKLLNKHKIELIQKISL